VTHRGPCQPRPFCDSVITLGDCRGVGAEMVIQKSRVLVSPLPVGTSLWGEVMGCVSSLRARQKGEVFAPGPPAAFGGAPAGLPSNHSFQRGWKRCSKKVTTTRSFHAESYLEFCKEYGLKRKEKARHPHLGGCR